MEFKIMLPYLVIDYLFVHIVSITPDILHQLYQGLLKHWVDSGSMWRCRDWCSLPSLAPKSPHPIIYEGHFTPLSCYGHRTWSNFQIPFGVGHRHWCSPSWWPFQYMTHLYSPCSPQFHLSSQIPYSHIWNTCSNEWHSSCIPPKLRYSCFSQHLHLFQHSKASQFWSLLWTYSALWCSWQF